MKIDMSRSVDQIQHICFALVPVIHRYRRGLDGYSPLALEIHVVKILIDFLTVGNCAGQLEHSVGKRALAMIDMRYDRKISYVLGIHLLYFHKSPQSSRDNDLIKTTRC